MHSEYARKFVERNGFIVHDHDGVPLLLCRLSFRGSAPPHHGHRGKDPRYTKRIARSSDCRGIATGDMATPLKGCVAVCRRVIALCRCDMSDNVAECLCLSLRRQVIELVGVPERSQSPLPDRFLEGELVPAEHVDVVEQQRGEPFDIFRLDQPAGGADLGHQPAVMPSCRAMEAMP